MNPDIHCIVQFMNLDILIRIEQKQKQSPGIYGTVDRGQKHQTDSDKHWKQR